MSHDPSGLKLAEHVRNTEPVTVPLELPSTPIMLELLIRGTVTEATGLLRRLEDLALDSEQVSALGSSVGGPLDRERLFPDTPALTDADLRLLESRERPVKRRWWRWAW